MPHKFVTFLFAMMLLTVAAAAQQIDHTEKGIELYREGKFAEAAQTLDAVVSVDKRNNRAWLYLGASRVKLGKTDLAIKCFRNWNYRKNEKSSEIFDKKLEVLARYRAEYTAEAQRSGVKGRIRVAFEYGADGKIGFVLPLTKLPAGLTESAIRAVEAIEFNPAWKNGRPVSIVTFMEFDFN